MTSKQFTLWLKGFVKAANPYNITPAQWDAITDELEKVVDEPESPFPFGVPNFNIEPIKLGPAYCTGTFPLTGSVKCASVWTTPLDSVTYTTTPGSTSSTIYAYNMSNANSSYTNDQNTKQQLND